MMYRVLSHADALKVLNILEVDISVTAVNDPLSNSNGQLLSETGIAVVVIVSPTTRREQIRLLYKALVLRDSFLFTYYRGEPLSLWKKILRPLLVVMQMGEEYIHFFDTAYWNEFKKTTYAVLEG